MDLDYAAGSLFPLILSFLSLGNLGVGHNRFLADLGTLITVAPLLSGALRFERCRRPPHPPWTLLSLLRSAPCLSPFPGGNLQKFRVRLEVMGGRRCRAHEGVKV